MEFDNSFDVPLPPSRAWAVLMDIPRIAPCMPGAELSEVIDAQTYKGKIAVRLGPVALAFAGRVEIDSIDDANRSARVKAQGSDAKGRGAANATATFHIEPAGDGSRVLIHTDLMLSGAVAQYGRGVGMIQATAAQIIGQFASNLRARLASEGPVAAAPARTPTPSAPAASAAAAPPPRQPQQNAPPAASPSMPPAARPISGLSLLARVVWQQIVGLFTRRRT
jgi:uncharacterized protein